MIDIPVLGGPCRIGELSYFLGVLVLLLALPAAWLRSRWGMYLLMIGVLVALVSLAAMPGAWRGI